jgi:hypothetical protein
MVINDYGVRLFRYGIFVGALKSNNDRDPGLTTPAASAILRPRVGSRYDGHCGQRSKSAPDSQVSRLACAFGGSAICLEGLIQTGFNDVSSFASTPGGKGALINDALTRTFRAPAPDLGAA